MKNDYLAYAKTFEAPTKVEKWIKSNLKNHLEKNEENQTEIEHIIDYLSLEGHKKNLELMSYKEALKNADTWTKNQIKKGQHIKEVENDTEIIHDFKDGFKIVKLVGKNAYEREGYLMSNCVASYYNSGKEIYSLRDKENIPHCTMERDQQVKGKGNGSIHPKYVGYIVKFLEEVGMTVGDNEMQNLGYLNVTKIKKYLSKDTKYFNKVYIYEQDKLIDKEGKEFASLELLDLKPLIKEEVDGELKINFDLKAFIPLSLNFLFKFSKKKDKSVQSSSGYSSKLASSGDSSKLASSGDYSQLASSGYSSQLASSGDSSKLASSGYSSKLASSGYSSKLASSGYSSKLASSGDYSKLASSGDSSKLASSGYSSKLASSGDYSKLEINGKNSVGANIGYDGKIKGILGSWITLAEYDSDGICICVKSAQIDGKKLKENTWYKLENKKFTEIK